MCICALRHHCLPSLQFVGNFCSAFGLFMKLLGDLFALTRLITLMKLWKPLARCAAEGSVSWSGDLARWSGSLPSPPPPMAISVAEPSAPVWVQQELIRNGSGVGSNTVGMRSYKFCLLMKGWSIYMVFGWVLCVRSVHWLWCTKQLFFVQVFVMNPSSLP